MGYWSSLGGTAVSSVGFRIKLYHYRLRRKPVALKMLRARPGRPAAMSARRANGLADGAVMDNDLTQPSLLSRVRDGSDQAAWREFEATIALKMLQARSGRPAATSARRADVLADGAVMDHDLTHPSLLSRVRDGSDQAAWREFEAKYRELLLRYSRARGLQQSDAEDVCQLVMTNLAQSLRNFDYSPEKGRFRSYLGRVVKNSISRHFARPNPADRALDTAVMAMVPDEGPDEKDDL